MVPTTQLRISFLPARDPPEPDISVYIVQSLPESFGCKNILAAFEDGPVKADFHWRGSEVVLGSHAVRFNYLNAGLCCTLCVSSRGLQYTIEIFQLGSRSTRRSVGRVVVLLGSSGGVWSFASCGGSGTAGDVPEKRISTTDSNPADNIETEAFLFTCFSYYFQRARERYLVVVVGGW